LTRPQVTPEFDRDGHRGPIGEHAATDAIPGLDDHDLLPGVDEVPGGAQTGGTRADHDDIELVVVGCPAFSRRARGEGAGREGSGGGTDEDATTADQMAVAFHIRLNPSITWVVCAFVARTTQISRPDTEFPIRRPAVAPPPVDGASIRETARERVPI
jgi:hypothetical protein